MDIAQALQSKLFFLCALSWQDCLHYVTFSAFAAPCPTPTVPLQLFNQPYPMICVSEIFLTLPFSWYRLSLPLPIQSSCKNSSFDFPPGFLPSTLRLTGWSLYLLHQLIISLLPVTGPLELRCRHNPTLSPGPLPTSCRGDLKRGWGSIPSHFASGCLIVLFYPSDSWSLHEMARASWGTCDHTHSSFLWTVEKRISRTFSRCYEIRRQKFIQRRSSG